MNLKQTKEIINSIYENSRDQIIPHMRGSAGIGKTSIVYQIAAEHKVNVVELICSQITYTELSGMPMPVEENRTMDIYDNQKLLDLKAGDILFLDEFDKSDVTVRQAVLKLLNERCLMSGKKLPDILIVAASNRTEQAEEIDDCIRDRFFYLEVNFDKDQWCNYISHLYHIDSSKLVSAIDTNDETETWNTLTPRSAEKLISYYSKAYNKDKKVANKFLKSVCNSELFIQELEEQLKNRSKSMEIITLLEDAAKTNKSIATIIPKLEKARVNEWYQIIDQHKSATKIKEILSKAEV